MVVRPLVFYTELDPFTGEIGEHNEALPRLMTQLAIAFARYERVVLPLDVLIEHSLALPAVELLGDLIDSGRVLFAAEHDALGLLGRIDAAIASTLAPFEERATRPGKQGPTRAPSLNRSPNARGRLHSLRALRARVHALLPRLVMARVEPLARSLAERLRDCLPRLARSGPLVADVVRVLEGSPAVTRSALLAFVAARAAVHHPREVSAIIWAVQAAYMESWRIALSAALQEEAELFPGLSAPHLAAALDRPWDSFSLRDLFAGFHAKLPAGYEARPAPTRVPADWTHAAHIVLGCLSASSVEPPRHPRATLDVSRFAVHMRGPARSDEEPEPTLCVAEGRLLTLLATSGSSGLELDELRQAFADLEALATAADRLPPRSPALGGRDAPAVSRTCRLHVSKTRANKTLRPLGIHVAIHHGRWRIADSPRSAADTALHHTPWELPAVAQVFDPCGLPFPPPAERLALRALADASPGALPLVVLARELGYEEDDWSIQRTLDVVDRAEVLLEGRPVPLVLDRVQKGMYAIARAEVS